MSEAISKSKRAGKFLGFWAALLLFTTILYFISSRFSFSNPSLSYMEAVYYTSFAYVTVKFLKGAVKK